MFAFSQRLSPAIDRRPMVAELNRETARYEREIQHL